MASKRTSPQLPTFLQGDGLYVFNAQGDKLADFTSAGSRLLLGYGQPQIVKAVQQQAELLWATPARSISQVEIQLYDLLEAVSPASINNFFLVETVSKAVERAVMLAQRATLRPRVMVFDGGSHGDSIQTMAMSAVKGNQRNHPGVSQVMIAPFPMATKNTDQEVAACLRQIERMFKTQTAPENIAAMIVEPVLDQGGAWVTPVTFLKEIESICRRWGILLIVNESRTSLRTGEWFSSVTAGIRPDMLILSGGLGNGLPLGVVGVDDDLGVHIEPHYPASVLAMAAAQEVINIVNTQRLVANAKAVGTALMSGLRDLQTEYGHIVDVRGQGLLVGTAFDSAERKVAATLVDACRNQGLFLQLWGSDDEVIGWMPPINTTEDQIDDALGIFEEALQSVLLQGR